MRILVLILILHAGLLLRSHAGVVINEIHFHPSSGDIREEFVELLNQGPRPIRIQGWRLAGGVEYTFPDRVMDPGTFLVVAADPERFRELHPTAPPALGGWSGWLGNDGDDLRLEDRDGRRVDEVRYSDEGDWASRVLGPIDHNHRGWVWSSSADRGGASLERVNPDLPGDTGQNWLPSGILHGTPGAPNSRFASNSAPFLLDPTHRPAVPDPGEPVRISVRVVDEDPAGVTVVLHYRPDGTAAFTSVRMLDDGRQDDGLAGDGIHGATLPGHAQGQVIEFYFEATDSSGQTRTWPAPVEIDGARRQVANALYQVDGARNSGSHPLLRLVMREVDRAELELIGRRFPDRESDARMNATFISQDGTGTDIRYLAGVRNRGHGSRDQLPNNYRVQFAGDHPWKGATAINLNGQHSWLQVLGSALCLKSGVPAAKARPVRLLVNGRDLSLSGPSPELTFGAYAAVQVLDADFVREFFPLDRAGNLYRGRRVVPPGASLAHLGASSDNYRTNYFKETNASEDDWGDLIELTRVLSSQTPDPSYPMAVETLVDVDEWLRYFAVNALVDNRETTLATGDGDDYYLYRGRTDSHFVLAPHDLDTILGFGSFSASPTSGLFRAANLPALDRLLKHPRFAPRYHATVRRLLATTFSEAEFNPLVDQLLGPWVAPDAIRRVKSFMRERRAHLMSMASGIVVSNALGSVQGYAHTRVPVVPLSGSADPASTAAVRINGQAAEWSPWNGLWSGSTPPLQPGINRILVQAIDASGREASRSTLDVWYESGSELRVGGMVLADTVWKAADGPFRVVERLIIPAGVTLVIEPGTSVYLVPGAGITVQGRLLAEGAPESRIRFTVPPGTSVPWENVTFQNATVESRLAHVDLEWGGGTGQVVRVLNSKVLLDNCHFAQCRSQYVTLENSSFLIRNCVFPDTSGVELIHGHGLPSDGYGVFDSNWFGTTTGLNDIIDFTGGKRPGAIVQFRGNIFTGGSDDILDLDGTDALIEGNLFLNCHQTASLVDTSSAISGGSAGGNTSDLMIVRNLFYDCDHVALAKEGNHYTLINNTAVHISRAAVVFDEPGRRESSGVTPGRGAWLDGNIFHEMPALFEHAYVDDPRFGTTEIVIHRSILPTARHLDAGVGNQMADPRLRWTPADIVDARNIRRAFQLRPGSPARGTGPNGIDMGADVPAGASMAGEPPSQTSDRSAVLTVGGPGMTHYRFRLDAGEFSEERPVTEPLRLANLADGNHSVAVLGRDFAGRWQDPERPSLSRTWTVQNLPPQPVLNEILVHRGWRSASVPPGIVDFPPMIEIANPSSIDLDLTGMSLTDDPRQPRKFVFPVGTRIDRGALRVVLLASNAPVADALVAPFALRGAGGAVHLFDRPEAGGRLLDEIGFGPQIDGFSIGRGGPSGDWSLHHPSPGMANRPALTGDPGAVRINEWLAASGPVFRQDFIELHNPDSLPVSLAGLTVTDEPLGRPERHRFLPLSFVAPKGFLLLWADGEPARGPDHLDFRLSAEQGMIQLADAEGRVIDWVCHGSQPVDVAEGRAPDGSATVLALGQPSPGGPNPAPGSPALANGPSTGAIASGSAPVVLNEVLVVDPGVVRPDGTIAGTGWIELANRSTNRVALAGLSLSDTTSEPRRWVFPVEAVIEAGGWFLIRCDDRPSASSTNAGFRLSRDGGAVLLFDRPESGGGLLDSIRFGAQIPGRSIGRIPDQEGEWHLTEPTPEVRNRELATADARRVRINEWSANPAAGRDWIELFNPAADPVALGGLHLTDDLLDRTRSTIPPLTFIGSGAQAWLRFEADSEPFQGPLDLSFKLAAEGEILALLQPDGTIVDAVGFGSAETDAVYGRFPDGAETVRRLVPTPAAANRPWTSDPADRDQDGLPDAWEEAHGLNPADATDANLDFDGDGMSHRDEFLAGTDPRAAASQLRIATVETVDGRIRVGCETVTGRRYSLLRAWAIEAPIWEPVAEWEAGSEGGHRMVDAGPAPASGALYFRIVLRISP